MNDKKESISNTSNQSVSSKETTFVSNGGPLLMPLASRVPPSTLPPPPPLPIQLPLLPQRPPPLPPRNKSVFSTASITLPERPPPPQIQQLLQTSNVKLLSSSTLSSASTSSIGKSIAPLHRSTANLSSTNTSLKVSDNSSSLIRHYLYVDLLSKNIKILYIIL